MKVDYISDLHLNHWVIFDHNQNKWEKKTKEFTEELFQNKQGEVLVIAGDFSEFNVQSIWFLEVVSKLYKRVYFTYGNHDLYLLSKNQMVKLKDSIGRLNDFLNRVEKLSNVIPLVKKVDKYKGIIFAGDAMWYKPKTESDWNFYRKYSNDSRFINIRGEKQDEIPIKLHKEAIEWYNTLSGEKIDVFVSHVPPIFPPFSPHSRNGCYETEVPFFTSKHWVCGHMHLKGTYHKAGTTFYFNAIGYPDELKQANRKLGIQSFIVK